MNNNHILENQARIRENITKSINPDTTSGLFEKGGEGTRGGKVIGHTSTGKPIYESSGGGNSRREASSTPAVKQAASEAHASIEAKKNSSEGQQRAAKHTSIKQGIQEKLGGAEHAAISSTASGHTDVTVHEKNHQAVHEHLESQGYKQGEKKHEYDKPDYVHSETGHKVSVSKISNRSKLPKVYRD